MFSGKLFQILGPAFLKALPPGVFFDRAPLCLSKTGKRMSLLRLVSLPCVITSYTDKHHFSKRNGISREY